MLSIKSSTLLINYTPWGNSLLGAAPIGQGVWVFVIPFAAGMFILEELRKWLARKRAARSFFPEWCLNPPDNKQVDATRCTARLTCAVERLLFESLSVG